MELTFKEFDESKQIEQHKVLFAKCFPEVYYTNQAIKLNYEQFFIHQYQSFPGKIKSFKYVAMIGDEMVGYYAALPYKYLINKILIQAGMVGGVMTSPNCRKMGVFTKLGNYSTIQQKAQGVSFNLTFPIRKAVMPGFKRMDWKDVFELPLYIKFLKLNSLLKNNKLTYLTAFSNPFIQIYNLLFKEKDSKEFIVRIFNNTDNIAGYDNFIKIYNENITNTLVKDKAFIRWRYGTPGNEYIFFCAYKEDNLVGFASARSITREGVPSYGILDFMTIDENCLPNLHNAITKQAQKDKREAIILMMSKISSKRYKLSKNAFLKSPYRFHFIIRILSNNFSSVELFDERKWHLMFVDTDDL